MASETLNEEIANTAIQATGTLFSVVGLVALVHLATLQGGTLPVASAAIYGATLVLAFLCSTLYHGVCISRRSREAKIRRFLRTIDHCAIYLLIAGTYTPIALLVLGDRSGWLLAATVWGLALTGAVLRIVWSHRFLKLRIGLYIALGWLVLLWGKPVFDGIGSQGTNLLVAGGVAYTSGVAFYLWRGLPFNEAVWHMFVILGSACFFAAIALYTIPAYA